MTTKLTTANFSTSLLSLVTQPTVSSIIVTDSSYIATGATAVDLAGGYIKITGSGFVSGSTVYIDSTPVTSVTFINSTQLNCVVPAFASNSYIVYVVNIDGSVAIRVNGITYSSTPTWTSSSIQASSPVVNIQLLATGDTSITYTLAAGSSLPQGLTLSSSGLLSGTVTGGGTTTYNFSVVATDVEIQISTRAFSVTVTFSDTYFTYVTMLLKGETSVTPFISDSSTNNLGLTIQGDTTANKFSPYYDDGYYSNFLGSSSDYLQVASNAVFAFPGAFTVEGWFYWPTIPSAGSLLGTLTNNGFNFYTDGTYLSFNIYGSGNVCAVSSFPSRNTWHHIAMTRDGSNNCTIWVDGVSSATGTSAHSFVQAAWTIYGGTNNGGAGYVSNLRVVKGTAVYTSAFTPSTTPLTAIANTQLLTCQSNRLIDKSTNAFTFTVGGSPQVSPAIPFTANSSYASYGSAFFNGTDGYMQAPLTPYNFAPAGDFTIEAWVYLIGASGNYTVASNWPSGSVSAQAFQFQVNTSGRLLFMFSTGGTQVEVTGTSTLVSVNAWNHVAVSRSGATVRLFVNGVQDSTTGSNAGALNVQSTSYKLAIGCRNDSGGYYFGWKGYITDFRFVGGTAVYTATFTPPTTLLTAVANTQLLTLQYNGGANNSGFIDNSNFNNIITRAGNTSQGTFSPYSVTGWSNYFDGTTDYLSLPNNAAFAFGTSDFTIEFWLYLNSTGQQMIWDGRPGSAAPTIYYYDSALRYYTNAADRIVGSSLSTGQWYHIALCRSSTSTKMFINGTQTGSTYSDSTTYTTSAPIIGADANAGNGSLSLNGYLSNFRIVKGTAVYTSAFTPSTTPLTAIANTVFLTSQSNRFIDNSPTNLTLTRVGDVSVQAFSPFGSIREATPISYSNYFDGTGDYLQGTSNAAFTFGTGAFTIEAWINPTVNGPTTGNWIYSNFSTGSGNSEIGFIRMNDGTIRLSTWNTSIVSSTLTAALNVWTHVVGSFDGTTYRLFVNGVLSGTSTNVQTLSGTGGPYIGTAGVAGISLFTGYISNLRVIKGTAVYITAFTPPAIPLTAIANTSLLTCQSTTMIDNSTNNFAITANGNVTPRILNPFGYTTQSSASYNPTTHGGSAYFDGTGDYLTNTTSIATVYGTGDFTVEYWMYLTANNGSFQSHVGRATDASCFAFGTNGTPALYWTTSNTSAIGNTALSLNQWYHVAWVRTSGTLKAYLNGVQDYTGSVAINITTAGFGIGGQPSGTLYPIGGGYLSDIRITKGTALYTGNFIPPTQSVTNYSTSVPASILLNFNNGGIIDQHSTNVLETVGNTQLSTSVKKYNNSSIYFDGTGDSLKVIDNPNINFGSGDFTLECWAYFNVVNAQMTIISKGWNSSSAYASYLIWMTNTGELRFLASSNGGAWDIANERVIGTMTAGVWTHIAVTRSGTTFRAFINGVIVNAFTFTSSASLASIAAQTLFIGDRTNGDTSINGYIDDLRITKGFARYTGTFIPPSSLQTS